MSDSAIDQRLATLRAEYEKGQQQLELLDRQRQDVRDTLLRIAGAIQVLEELQAQTAAAASAAAPAAVPVTSKGSGAHAER